MHVFYCQLSHSLYTRNLSFLDDFQKSDKQMLFSMYEMLICMKYGYVSIFKIFCVWLWWLQICLKPPCSINSLVHGSEY